MNCTRCGCKLVRCYLEICGVQVRLMGCPVLLERLMKQMRRLEREMEQEDC